MTIEFCAGRSNSLENQIKQSAPIDLVSLHLASGFFSEIGGELLEHLLTQNSCTLREIWIVVGWSRLEGLQSLARIKEDVLRWPRKPSLNIALDFGKRGRGKLLYNQMHSKLLVVSSSSETMSVVGSSNYTGNGLYDNANEEANIIFTGYSATNLESEVQTEVERLVKSATPLDTRKLSVYAEHYRNLGSHLFFPETKTGGQKIEKDYFELDGFLDLNLQKSMPPFALDHRIFFKNCPSVKNPYLLILIRLSFRGVKTDECLLVQVENAATAGNSITNQCDWEADLDTSKLSIEKISPTKQCSSSGSGSSYSGQIKKLTSIYAIYYRFSNVPEQKNGQDLKVRVDYKNPEKVTDGNQVEDVDEKNKDVLPLLNFLDDADKIATGQGMVFFCRHDEKVSVEIHRDRDEESTVFNEHMKRYERPS